ncbi:endo-beta-N-acetylglucosaminidase [Spiroplasma apis]|uniref:Cytosolic endo-beta-N-acetylglucosaminidase TIM barrel domain-containing protein n=1 Tax=Spiroplasma apis B31 TaxID=1276258 RepID=V5RIF8_SPIAP|nr:hypothetical protein [Spiroplasma apis]AHB36472.1 hypothetical protein SAPIS_v1c06270 [Spiroplasma apis B31]
MKKLINFMLSLSIVLPTTLFVVSCNIGELSSNKFLSSLKDFDWEKDSRGNDINVPTVSVDYLLKNESDFNFEESNEIVEPNFKGSYFDYDVLDTNFKESSSLTKQAVTGVPINKIYSSGNTWAEFGITSKARKGLRANTILEWNNNKDIDLKYGMSTEKLQKRTKTALKSVETQDERISFGDIRDHSRVNGSYQATNVGTRNTFEKTISNYQYRDYLFDWGQHGNISPPAADVIDAGHINGTPVFGLIFLSGYGGLSRNDVADFLEKNSDGTYKIVDVLIDMAITYGFDGWFFNDEANGGWPHGTVTSSNYAFDVVKQYRDKTKNSNDEKKKNLKLAYYKDSATYDQVNGTPVYGDYVKTAEYADIAQLDFRVSPDTNNRYLTDNKINPNKVHNLIELSANYGFIGNYDFRNLVYGKASTNPDENEYNKNIYQSFSSFSGAGSGEFGSQAFQIANKNVDLTNYQQRLNSFLYAQQVANLYENYMFSGLNSSLSSKDKGLNANYRNNVSNMIKADPRIDTGNEKVDDNNPIYKVYDYKENNGLISNSFGIGNIIQEFTTINDENLADKGGIKSNFSLGNGITFLNRNKEGKLLTKTSNYPWTNRRFTDLNPTYNFDMKQNNQNNLSSLPITGGLNGFYDYYDIYQKGNSLAFGGQLKLDGSITEGTWKANSIYDWNIMGSNLSKDSYDISFIVKASHDNKVLNDVIKNINVLTTFTNDGKREIIESHKPVIENLEDGWSRITIKNIATSKEKTLAKIGLKINVNDNTQFKFNVGEFNISKTTNPYKGAKVKKLSSEAIITRGNGNTNVRLEWETDNNNYDYFEVYYNLVNKWYRVGESKIKAAYIPNLPFNENMLKIGLRPVTQDGENNTLSIFKIKL